MAKPKNRGALQRRKPQRKPYDRVLIVCEGETEQVYLRELCQAQRLTGVRIVGRGAGPAAVWKRTREEFDRDREYDHIFCVFDRDTHAHYAEVLAEIRHQIKVGRIGKHRAGKTRLQPVPSDPCFEFWLLLHFQATTAVFKGPDEVLNRLHRCEGMGAFQKNQNGWYAVLLPRLEAALTNAKEVRRQLQASGADTPQTDLDSLVEYLHEQAERHVPVR